MKPALIVEPNERSDITEWSASREELLRAHDPELGEPSVRREPYLGAKGAAEAILVEASVLGELVEGDRLRDTLAE